MNQFPYGARYIFEDLTESILDGLNPRVKDEWLRAFTAFRENQSILLEPLLEIDGLLDSDDQWESFASVLMYQAREHSREAAQYTRGKRKEVIALKYEIYDALQEVRRLTLKLESIGDEEEEDYFPPSVKNPLAWLSQAANLQNQVSSNVCTYHDDLESKIQTLIKRTSPEAIPELSFLLLSLAFHFRCGKKEEEFFDPLNFSNRSSPGDFIRGFTDTLKSGIKDCAFPNKLRTLSFRSIEAFAGVLFPHTIIKASNYIDADWKPIKNKTGQ